MLTLSIEVAHMRRCVRVAKRVCYFRVALCTSSVRLPEREVALLFSTETGEDLSGHALAEMKGPTSNRLQTVFDRLAEMSDRFAASLTSV